MSVAAFPSSLMISFIPSPQNAKELQSETLIYVYSQGLNCSNLLDYADLAHQLAFRQISILDALVQIRQISERPPLFGRIISLVSFAVMAGLSPLAFYGGGIFGALLASLLGTVLGVLEMYFGSKSRIRTIIPFLTAVLFSFVCVAVATLTPDGFVFCPLAVVFSAILWMLPGLSITTAVAELAAKAIIAGTSRFFSAMLTALQLGYGIMLGTNLVLWHPDPQSILIAGLSGCSESPSVWFSPLWLLVITCTTNILTNSRFALWPASSGAAMLGFITFSLLGSTTFSLVDDQTAIAIASFAIGVCGQLVARYTGHQSLVTILCGILVLVPGGLGTRGALRIVCYEFIFF